MWSSTWFASHSSAMSGQLLAYTLNRTRSTQVRRYLRCERSTKIPPHDRQCCWIILGRWGVCRLVTGSSTDVRTLIFHNLIWGVVMMGHVRYGDIIVFQRLNPHSFLARACPLISTHISSFLAQVLLRLLLIPEQQWGSLSAPTLAPKYKYSNGQTKPSLSPKCPLHNIQRNTSWD